MGQSGQILPFANGFVIKKMRFCIKFTFFFPRSEKGTLRETTVFKSLPREPPRCSSFFFFFFFQFCGCFGVWMMNVALTGSWCCWWSSCDHGGDAFTIQAHVGRAIFEGGLAYRSYCRGRFDLFDHLPRPSHCAQRASELLREDLVAGHGDGCLGSRGVFLHWAIHESSQREYIISVNPELPSACMMFAYC